MPVFGGVSGRRSSGAHTLLLGAHVPLLGLFSLKEIRVDSLDVHKGTGPVISSADGSKLSCLGEKTRRNAETANRGLYAWNFVDMIDCFPWRGTYAHGFGVALHRTDLGSVVEGIEGAATIRAVQEQRVGVDIFDAPGKWDALEFLAWAPPPLEDSGLADVNPGIAAVVDIDLAAVVDGGVPGVGAC